MAMQAPPERNRYVDFLRALSILAVVVGHWLVAAPYLKDGAVEGGVGVGEVALSANEYKTAERLKRDYWLYVIFNCATTPALHAVQDPSRLGWKPVVQVAHYHVVAGEILRHSQESPGAAV